MVWFYFITRNDFHQHQFKSNCLTFLFFSLSGWTRYQVLVILHPSITRLCSHSYCSLLKSLLAHRVLSWTSSRFFLRLIQRTRSFSCSLGLCFSRCISELVEAIVQESLSFISSSLQSELVVRSLLWSSAYSKLSEQSCFSVLAFLMFVIWCSCVCFNRSLSWICLEKSFRLHRYQIERIPASRLVGHTLISLLIEWRINQWIMRFRKSNTQSLFIYQGFIWTNLW